MFYCITLFKSSFKTVNCTSSEYFNTSLLTVYRFIRSFAAYRKKQSITKMTSKNKAIFGGITDTFNGITINSQAETCSVEEFPNKLKASLKSWMDAKKRGIWFKVGIQQADWVPILAKHGFNFHHAKPDFVMMYKWLPKDESCNIPNFANTMIGVGAVVVNNKKKILVVSEKYIDRPHWKLPGGYVEPGENIVDAAIREVLEETGVETEFQTLLSLRHGHHGLFGCSDMYIVVGLKPLTEDISKCEREIKSCEWMDIDTYFGHPHVHELNRFFAQKYFENKEKNIKITCDHGIHPHLKRPYTMYHAISEDNSE